MLKVRNVIGGLGNLMFKQAYLWGQMMDGEIPDVYVQSSKYWNKYQHHIRAMYSEGIVPNDKIALHIRRGDYTNNPFYVDLWKTDYYQKAIALTDAQCGSYDLQSFYDAPHYLVFCRDNQGWDTDKADRQWCRVNLTPLLGDRWDLAPKENSETDDLNLMAGCKAIIGANSSFAWWAAFLGDHEKIIMPANDKWYTDGVERTECPEEWIRL